MSTAHCASLRYGLHGTPSVRSLCWHQLLNHKNNKSAIGERLQHSAMMLGGRSAHASMDYEFCSHVPCLTTNSKPLDCSGPNCKLKIHLECCGFLKGTLAREVKLSSLSLLWFCDNCRKHILNDSAPTMSLLHGIRDGVREIQNMMQNQATSMDNRLHTLMTSAKHLTKLSL